MFGDGLKYVGSFSNNSRQGEGFANYHGTDANYEGLWKNGRYNGEGVQKCHGGSLYKGNFVVGRRDGQGVVKYGRGIHYEGEFRDGKPHGRGFMYSELSGYAFEGMRRRGSILCGTSCLLVYLAYPPLPRVSYSPPPSPWLD